MLFATFTDTAKFTPQGGARVQPLIFSLFPGNLVLAVLTATSAAIYTGCRPVRSGWPGVVGAFDMDTRGSYFVVELVHGHLFVLLF